jgi:glycosyltransferase involved in cell wall biosynthesis
MKKILLICNSSQSVYTFRLPLIKKLKSEGFDVNVISFDNNYKELLSEQGIEIILVEDNRRSVNPFSQIALKKRLYKEIKNVDPDIVFTFMAKPNTFGVLAANKAKVKKIYSMVEGLGDPFINQSFKWKLIRFSLCRLYKKAFKKVDGAFFLNEDDKNKFIDLKLVNKDKAHIINGIGVDLNKFSFKPVDRDSNSFVMIARMLKTKGVYEYCECAKIVKEKRPNSEFLYIGGEGTVKLDDIKEYIDGGYINYIGTVNDVRPYVEKSLGMILPSYREGMPMAIMEAEGIGRAIIANNTTGCKHTVVHNYNGYLVDNNDPLKMAEYCIELLDNKDKAVEFGNNSRQHAEEYFDQNVINEKIIKFLND